MLSENVNFLSPRVNPDALVASTLVILKFAKLD
jgi:hypothetical protein